MSRKRLSSGRHTAVRLEAPTVLLVALDDQIGGVCFAFFDDGGMRIVAVRTVAAGCTRIVEAMPVLIVVQAEISASDVASLDEHASAAGAEIVAMERGASEATIKQRLREALQRVGQRKRVARPQ